MTFIIVHKGFRGKYNMSLTNKEMHSIIREMLGRKRNMTMGANLLNFVSYVWDMSMETYAKERMGWKMPNDVKRWLQHGRD